MNYNKVHYILYDSPDVCLKLQRNMLKHRVQCSDLVFVKSLITCRPVFQVENVFGGSLTVSALSELGGKALLMYQVTQAKVFFPPPVCRSYCVLCPKLVLMEHVLFLHMFYFRRAQDFFPTWGSAVLELKCNIQLRFFHVQESNPH